MTDDYASIKYAEKDSPPKLRPNDRYFGTYQGIRFEISKRPGFGSAFDNEFNWCHYIYLHIDEQIPEKFRKNFWLKPRRYRLSPTSREMTSYDYNKGLIGNITFHGGCTWYSKETCIDNRSRVVKIGCDYQHYWDEGQRYTLESVYSEVKETIDSLIKLIGPVKIRSGGDGHWRYIEEFNP